MGKQRDGKAQLFYWLLFTDHLMDECHLKKIKLRSPSGLNSRATFTSKSIHSLWIWQLRRLVIFFLVKNMKLANQHSW